LGTTDVSTDVPEPMPVKQQQNMLNWASYGEEDTLIGIPVTGLEEISFTKFWQPLYYIQHAGNFEKKHTHHSDLQEMLMIVCNWLLSFAMAADSHKLMVSFSPEWLYCLLRFFGVPRTQSKRAMDIRTTHKPPRIAAVLDFPL
jgi:hypothetical protein